MKKAVTLSLLLGLLALCASSSVFAGQFVVVNSINVTCSPLAVDYPSAAYNVGVGNTMTWNISGACAPSVDLVRIEFGALTPWGAGPITYSAAPGGSVTSGNNNTAGVFKYNVITEKLGVPQDTIEAWMVSGEKVPSLSTWAVLILVLGLIAVSIALLRKKIRVGV